ncbi:hypothetical protein Tco_0116476 [Tanacetum coccineum]
MANLKFADTHNLVVFSKPTESEGFEQIVDFLNANLIRYALMINPTIYILCIEQFWSTIKAKTVNSTIFEQLTLMGESFFWKGNTIIPNNGGTDQAEMGDDKAVYKKLDDSLVRAATTASSLEAEQDSSNITKTQSKATPNESS